MYASVSISPTLHLCPKKSTYCISQQQHGKDVLLRSNQVSYCSMNVGCCTRTLQVTDSMYEGDSISKLQMVIEKKRMEIMTYKQHLFFNIISIQI